jgi:hypothetical protein
MLVWGMSLKRGYCRTDRRNGKNQSVHWKVDTTFLGAGFELGRRPRQRPAFKDERSETTRSRELPGTRNMFPGGGVSVVVCVSRGRSEVVLLLAERYIYGRYTMTPSRIMI